MYTHSGRLLISLKMSPRVRVRVRVRVGVRVRVRLRLRLRLTEGARRDPAQLVVLAVTDHREGLARAGLAVAHDRAVEAVEHGVADRAGHLFEDRLLRRVVENGVAREREELLLGMRARLRVTIRLGRLRVRVSIRLRLRAHGKGQAQAWA